MAAVEMHEYVIEQRGDQWCVLTSDRSRTLGCHDTREEAEAQLRAVEASKHNELLTIPNREIFRAGVWNGDRYTIADLDAIVEAYRETGYQPPLKPGHTNEPGTQALGAVANLRRVGDKLIGDFVDLTKDVYDAIKQRRWRHVSAEIMWNLKRGSRVFRRFLSAVALLGADMPAVEGLKPVFSEVYTMAYDSIRRYTIPPSEIRLTAAQVEKLCAPCAKKMRASGMRELIIRQVDGTYQMPPQLREGLCRAIGDDPGFFTRCRDMISDEITDKDAFCNWLHNECLGTFPGEHQEETMPKTYRVEQRGDEWCLIGEDNVATACYPTKEEAEAALQRILAPQAEAAQAEAAQVQQLKEAVQRYRQEAEEAKRLAQQLQEERRRERIASKVARLAVPAWRPYLQAIYEVATAPAGAARIVKFSAADGAQAERQAEDVVDEFLNAVNAAARTLFTELAVADNVERPTEPPAQDPGVELDRRIRRYCEEHKLQYERLEDYQQAKRAVLAADPDLLRRYAGA